MARVANRHDLWVLSDEVYEEVYFGDPPPATWARDDLIQRTVAVHSMSKAYAMAGARVGWAHGPSDAMAAVRAAHVYQDFGPAKSQQLIAARVLREGDTWMAKTRVSYEKASRLVSRLLGLSKIQGGTFAFARVADNLDEFLIRCAQKGVLLAPGRVCGKNYTDWYRLCFTSIPPNELEEALAIVRSVISNRQT